MIMRNILKSFLALTFGLSLMAIPGTSHAADGLSVKAEAGLAVASTEPQSSRFNLGGGLKLQPLIGLTSWLDIGPSVSLLALTSDRPGIPAGTVVGLGGGARVKRPHDASNEGSGFSAVSPWADFDVQYVRTAQLNRPGFAVGAGASVPTSDARTVWVGPFARYQEVTQQSHGVYFDTRNAKIFVFGISVEVGPRVKRNVEELDSDNDGTPDSQDHCPYVPGPKDNFGCPREVQTPVETPNPPVVEVQPVPVAPVELELKQKVQFPWDSATLLKGQVPHLEEVVAALLANVDYNIRVEGHASSEGQVEHNQKLSERRAQSVVEYLVAHGVARSRLTAVGFGSSVPVADNATEAGRVANRRVEFDVKFVLVKGSDSK